MLFGGVGKRIGLNGCHKRGCVFQKNMAVWGLGRGMSST